MLFIVLLVFLASWHTVVTVQYALVLEEAHHCMADSKIVLNYTYKRETNKGIGYFEFLEPIESNSKTLISIGLQYKTQEISFFNKLKDINITKSDFCVMLNSDRIFLPYFRQFTNVEKFCPINKGVHAFRKSTIYFRIQPLLPLGCWNLEVNIEKYGKPFACLYYSVQMLQSLDSRHTKCN